MSKVVIYHFKFLPAEPNMASNSQASLLNNPTPFSSPRFCASIIFNQTLCYPY